MFIIVCIKQLMSLRTTTFLPDFDFGNYSFLLCPVVKEKYIFDREE